MTTACQYTLNSTILQTAKIRVHSQDGHEISATLLFDSASDRTYVTKKLVQLTKPHRIGQEMISFSTFGGESSSKPTLRSVYDLHLLDSSDRTHSLAAVEVPTICEPLRRTQVPREVLQLFNHLPLADSYEYEQTLEVQILVGIDALWILIDPTQLKLRSMVTLWLSIACLDMFYRVR